MYFRLTNSIRQLSLFQKEEIILLEEQNIEIKISNPTPEEIKNGAKHDTLIGATVFEFQPNRKDLDILEKIIGRKPLGFDTKETRGYRLTKEEPQYFVPHLDAFPEHFRNFHNQAKDILEKAFKSTIDKIIWLHNYNAQNLYAFRDFEFSKDKLTWDSMPITMQVSVSIGEFPVLLSSESKNMIAAKDIQTPMHHSLFLEAWNQRTISRRSSLAMGIAALEGAIKYMVVKRVPDSAWFIENSPSPSVQAMLTEMIKTLPIENKVDGKIKTLSKTTMDDIKKWIAVRNKLMHKGVEFPKTFRIEIILRTIKSIIYLMDYYSGEVWAIRYVDKNILEN